MTVEEFLGRSLKTDKEIKDYKEKLARYKAQAEKVTTTLTGMPHGTSSEGSAQEKYAVKKEELAKKLNELCSRQFDEREEIEELIDTLKNENERKVLKAYYLDGLRKCEIAGKYFMSLTTLKRSMKNGKIKIMRLIT